MSRQTVADDPRSVCEFWSGSDRPSILYQRAGKLVAVETNENGNVEATPDAFEALLLESGWQKVDE